MSEYADTDKLEIVMPKGMRYDCSCCGRCCSRDWDKHIGPVTYRRIKESPLFQTLIEKAGTDDLFHFKEEKECCVINQKDGRCIFMREDGLCHIHAEINFDIKPVGCRLYPLIITPTPGGIFVGLSFTCKSVLEETGNLAETYVELVRDGLKEYRSPLFGGEELQIVKDLNTDWEGYLAIEEVVGRFMKSNERIYDGLWKAMTALSVMAAEYTFKPRKWITAEEILEYFSKPVPIPIGRDEIYEDLELSLTTAMISLLESKEDEDKRQNTETLMQGGTLFCDTFKKVITVPSLAGYTQQEHPKWKERELRRYFEHLLWRKHIVRGDSIMQILASMVILVPFIEWYTRANAVLRGAEKVERQDLLYGISQGDLVATHCQRAMLPFFKVFAESFYEQMAMFYDPALKD